jgi:hypothetical protein
MPEAQPVTRETVAQMAVEIVRIAVPESQQAPVAELLNALAADMQAFRQMDVGGVEPATVYAAVEGQP